RTTQDIAARIDGHAMPDPAPRLPKYPVPDGYDSEDDFLRELIYDGARERYGDDLPDHVVKRIESELAVIIPMGFSSYFLIVWDLITNRKSTRLNSSHVSISYAVFCLKKKKKQYNQNFRKQKLNINKYILKQ